MIRDLTFRLIGASLVAVSGAALLGWADNVSHHHPVNHAVEGPLIIGGFILLCLGFLGLLCVIVAAVADK